MSQRKPRSRLAFRHAGRGLQLRSREQKLVGIGLPGLGQLNPKIQVRLENIRLRRHRLAVRRNRIVGLPQRVRDKAQVKPRHIVLRIGSRQPCAATVPPQRSRASQSAIRPASTQVELASSRTLLWRIVWLESGPVRRWIGLEEDSPEFVTRAKRKYLCRRGRRTRGLSARERACGRNTASTPTLRAAIGTRCAIAIQDTRQIFSGVRPGQLRNRFRRSRAHNLAAAIPALRAQIDHPIRGLDDLQIVLDDDNRSPCFDQTAKRRQEFADVIKM